MRERGLPPFALFDDWGIGHDLTIGECADKLRQLYEGRQAENQNDKYAEIARESRLLERLSMRYVQRETGISSHTIRRLEAGKNLRNADKLFGLLHFYDPSIQTDIRNRALGLIVGAYPTRIKRMYDVANAMQILTRIDFSLLAEHKEALEGEAREYLLSFLGKESDEDKRPVYLLFLVPPSIEEAIGRNLKFLRKKHGLSVIQAAAQSGVSAEKIVKLERGEGREIALKTLVPLGSLYGEPCPIKLMQWEYYLQRYGYGSDSFSDLEKACINDAQRERKLEQ